jgi:prepilin-type N-terminal cleavage/methylation domain-containing protein
MRRACGFTLVELLVVLAILGLLVALVGPLTVDRLDKARAQEEWIVLDRTLRGLAFRAFVEGRDVEIHGEGARLTWVMAGSAGQSRNLEQLFFDEPQSVRINSNGIAEPAALRLHQRGNPRTLELNSWLEDGT